MLKKPVVRIMVMVIVGVLLYFYLVGKQAVLGQNPIAAKQKALINLTYDYGRLEAASHSLSRNKEDRVRNAEVIADMREQQVKILQKIREDAALITGNVPPEVQEFLDAHPAKKP